jgi:predicted transcriptional regulator
MTERVLHLHVEDEDAFMRRASEAFKRAEAGEDIAEQDHLSFTDILTFLSSLSPKRWQLVTRLHADGPSSIRALAARVARDYKSVHVDIGKLKELGLVEKTPNGLVHVPFDRIVADIHFRSPAAAAE